MNIIFTGRCVSVLLHVQYGDVQSAYLRYIPVPGMGYRYGMDYRDHTHSAYTVLHRQTRHHQPGLTYAGMIESFYGQIARRCYIYPRYTHVLKIHGRYYR